MIKNGLIHGINKTRINFKPNGLIFKIKFPLKLNNLINLRFNSTNSVKTSLISEEIVDKLPSFEDEAITALNSVSSNEIGYLKSIGLGQGWGPTSLVENMLEIAHVYTGLPWWGTIVAVTVGVRLFMIPLYVKASANAAKTSAIKPELDKAMSDLKNAVSTEDKLTAIQFRKKLMKENNIKMIHQLFPVLQLPLAYGFFQGLRKMANYPVEGFSTGGAYWFEDLTNVDPYIGLQVLSAAFVIGLVKLGGETGASTLSKPMKNIMTLLPILSIVITKNLSSAVVLYFAVNSAFSFFQNVMITNKTFRKLVGIPAFVKRQPLPGMEKSPETFSDLFGSFKEKSKKTAMNSAKKTNIKLEALEKRKQAARSGFVKKTLPRK